MKRSPRKGSNLGLELRRLGPGHRDEEMVPSEGIEPPTLPVEAACTSVVLRRRGGEDENRTREIFVCSEAPCHSVHLPARSRLARGMLNGLLPIAGFHPWRHFTQARERQTRIELVRASLARRCRTTGPLSRSCTSSGQRESNARLQFGKLRYYLCTMPALHFELVG